ncbi:MAG: twin-arginine translocation signal domain-containing protein [Planctomycetota bacterium]|nr:MAG: twin-arginine translocation signal domain-containing protein [Planctomycetota bacterium]
MSELSRRGFLQSAAAVAATGVFGPSVVTTKAEHADRANGDIVVVSSANGLRATKKASELLAAGTDPLDAVIAGVNIVEEDPDDMTVGYGGLPNEDGVVELDSCVMHGPTCRCGAVAALRNIKTPSRVAKTVMERTDHILLVGEGALRFARAHGFTEVNLLTDKARRVWLRWKETLSKDDDWIPPEVPDDDAQSNALADIPFTYGTIHCCARDASGNLGAVTTTSGLSFKIPGRVGDSPIIGAGLYVDNKVGAAGSTGRGEAVIKICGSHTVVEAMRQGMSPTDACLYALRRIVETTTEKRLLRKDGRPNFDVKFYALSKSGEFGAAAIWSGAKFSVFSAGRNRHEPCAYLYERPKKRS